ncbi:MAG: hypothetical protein ACKOWF_09500, partial [Chloroflexota bacterium]
PTATPTPTSTPLPGKRLLAQSDVTWLGAFRLPATAAGGGDAAWGRGLALRRVGGQLRLLAATVDERVYEVAVPAPGATAPYPLAAETATWADIFGGRRLLDGGRTGSLLHGLFWDEPSQRLYWSYGDPYNAVSTGDPCLGWSSLGAGTAEAHGPWRFTGRSVKMTMGGVLAVPPAFAAAHLGGRRLAAGFGGYFSIVATGPASMGPALAAFSPEALGAPGPGDAGDVDHLPLCGYPFQAAGPDADGPFRCWRDSDYDEEFDSGAWNPTGGHGWWTWTDFLWQAAAWIDTPAVEGVLFAPTVGNGRVWYEASSLNAERSSNWWMVYAPGDLARVAAGSAPGWGIQPAARWQPGYPGLPPLATTGWGRAIPGGGDEPPNLVTGMAWDPEGARLYVAVRFGWREDGTSGHAVHVFGIAAG